MCVLAVRMKVEFQSALRAVKLQVAVRGGQAVSHSNSFCIVSSKHTAESELFSFSLVADLMLGRG